MHISHNLKTAEGWGTRALSNCFWLYFSLRFSSSNPLPSYVYKTLWCWKRAVKTVRGGKSHPLHLRS